MSNRADYSVTRAVWVLPVHTLAVILIQATQWAVMFVLSVLARKHFSANNLEVLLITATPTVLFVLSIFWNDYFERRTFGRYLLVYWLVASLPLAFAAFATNVWMLIVPHLISSLGGAGYHPAAGELLKRLYGEKRRGRVYAILWGSAMAVGAFASLGIGEWLSKDVNAFRWYMPLAAVLQLLGVGLLVWIGQVTGVSAARKLRENVPSGERLKRLLDPVLHMGTVLKQDPTFARYEAAYMTYGIGWMVAYALLPLLVTDKLHLEYDTITQSTTVPYQLAVVLMLWPAGLLMDKLGAVRSTGLSFLMLAIYPLGLIFSGDAHELLITSVWYGIAHAGASVGWMVGPVSLAPSPDKVPKYVAIHATLVGLRGSIFQGLGVLLLQVTGSFTWPLLLAAAAYVWSAVQMWQLHGRMAAGARVVRADAAGAAKLVPPEETQ